MNEATTGEVGAEDPCRSVPTGPTGTAPPRTVAAAPEAGAPIVGAPDLPEADVFCRIVAGELPAQVVLDEPELLAFLDIRPLIKGHVLLVPKRHVDNLLDLPAELRDPFLAAGLRLAAAVERGLGASGSFVATNVKVSQSVPHLHLHVVPRSKGDGLRGFFWPRHTYAEGEAAQYAAKIRAALDQQSAD